jgi:stage II sporulation protein P
MTLALFLRFDGRSGPLAYEILYLQFPFLGEYREPDPPPSTERNDQIVIEHAAVDPGVSDTIKIRLSRSSRMDPVDLSGKEPRILIYHTHTTEAYRQTQEYVYVASGDSRTLENDKNIVAVGDRLTELLRDKYGISVIHDTTNHEPPKLGTSYSRSVITMEAYKAKYPTITMFIDIHRDASSDTEDYIVIDGRRVARMMFVVGTGEGATGTGFKDMPDFESNFALAKRITEQLLKVDPRLMRDIRVKTGRYNQHISSQCLLVEIGHNSNTLDEAIAAVEYLAAAIADCGGMGVTVTNGETASGSSVDTMAASGEVNTGKTIVIGNDVTGSDTGNDIGNGDAPLPLIP